MKIALVGAIGNYNVGDEAIFFSNLEAISYWDKNARIFAFTRDPTYTSLLYANSFPLQIIPVDYIRRYVVQHPCEFNSLLSANINLTNFQPSLEGFDFLEASLHEVFQEIDILHIIGGGFINSLWNDLLFEVLIPIHLADKYNKKILCTGQTIGPLFEEHSSFVKETLKKVHYLDTRDYAGAKYVEELGIRQGTTVDDALCMNCRGVKLPQQLTLLLKQPYINILIQDWNFPNEQTKETLKEVLASFITKMLIDNVDIKVNFLGFFHYNRDLEMAKSISSLLEQKLLERISFLQLNKFHPCVSKYVVGNALYNIGTRFHLAVFSLSSFVPVYSLILDEYYSYKILGVHRLYNSRNFNYVEGIEESILIDFHNRVLQNNEKIREDLKQIHLETIQKLYKNKLYWQGRLYGGNKLAKLFNIVKLGVV